MLARSERIRSPKVRIPSECLLVDSTAGETSQRRYMGPEILGRSRLHLIEGNTAGTTNPAALTA